MTKAMSALLASMLFVVLCALVGVVSGEMRTRTPDGQPGAGAIQPVGAGSESAEASPSSFDIGGPTPPPERIADQSVLRAAPNLYITSVQITNGSGVAITPVAGQPFFVRVNFAHEGAFCDSYTIGRRINAWEQNEADPIDWGCSVGGTSFWWHNWGAWVLHEAGSYSVDVTIDVGKAVAETDESDNSMTLNFNVGGTQTAQWELVEADYGRANLGDGTSVIVGTMDDAFDFNHPWFDGDDSLGQPRLVAALQNDLGPDDSPINAGHATSLMGIALADGDAPGDIVGLAPDARYVTAEFINRANEPSVTVPHVLDAAGFLIQNGVEVVNMSWSWWFGTTDDSYNGETAVTNLMADYMSYALDIVCVPAVNQLGQHLYPTSPGSSRNVITVGGLDANLVRAWSEQDYGPTLDGRSKPDLLGNDAVDSVSTVEAWREGFPSSSGLGGTSVSAPFVTGAVAQMLDYGKTNGGSTDHRVIKAVIMNSGVQAQDFDGSAWSNSPTQPLDDQQGTGILNMRRVHEMYSAGSQTGTRADVAVPGYTDDAVSGDTGSGSGTRSYMLGEVTVTGGDIRATLAWSRHTFWNDANVSGSIDEGDSFYTSAADPHVQDNLDLVLYRDGAPIAESRSTVDTIEHITLSNAPPGVYELVVERLAVTNSGTDERYGLAWWSDAQFGPPCPDTSGDGMVDGVDLAGLLASWGTNSPLFDFTNDGVVDGADLATLLAAWGPC